MFRISFAVLRSVGRRPKRSKTACRKLPWGHPLQRGMRSLIVVFFSVHSTQDFRLQFAGKEFYIQELVPQPGVEALRVGVLPRRSGLDVERLEPLSIHSLTSRATNSGPLSLRMNSGAPRSATNFSRMQTTSRAPTACSASKPRHSRVYSSRTSSHFNRRPPSVWSKTKS